MNALLNLLDDQKNEEQNCNSLIFVLKFFTSDDINVANRP